LILVIAVGCAGTSARTSDGVIGSSGYRASERTVESTVPVFPKSQRIGLSSRPRSDRGQPPVRGL